MLLACLVPVPPRLVGSRAHCPALAMSADDDAARRLNALYDGATASSTSEVPTWSALIGWIGNSPEFEAGIRLIERGEYRTSVTLLTRAVAEVPGGTVCKLGGFYSCWLAQALHNAGSEAEAKALLERLSSHADAEVRRSASDMLAIFTAPKLDFVEGTFLTIPPLTPDDGWSRTAGSSGGRSGQQRQETTAAPPPPSPAVEPSSDVPVDGQRRAALVGLLVWQLVEVALWLNGADDADASSLLPNLPPSGMPLQVAAPAAPPATSDMPTAETTAEQLQQCVLREHAARFDGGSTPVAVVSSTFRGRQMRSLVATVDVPPDARVAAYPVEVVSDDDSHDDTYALGIFRQLGAESSSSPRPAARIELDDVSGVPTRKSLARAYVDGLPTLGMFANEPDARHAPNCELIFPTTTAARVELGEVYCGYLKTIRRVRKGEPITWCYGSSYLARDYATSCAAVRA